jgi:hypothetical protein
MSDAEVLLWGFGILFIGVPIGIGIMILLMGIGTRIAEERR